MTSAYKVYTRNIQ